MPQEFVKGALFFAWLAIVPLALIALLRLLAHDATMVLIWFNAETFALYLPAYAVLALATQQRRRLLASVAASVVLCHLCWIAPDYGFAEPLPKTIAASHKLRLFSANLLMVNPTPEPIIDEIKAAAPDVILLQEFSPAWQQALHDSGILADYPHRVGVVRDDSFGTLILSKRILHDAQSWDVAGLPMSKATVQVGGRAVAIINVHTLPPRLADYTEVWRRQMAILTETAERATGPLALIGDFNATQHALGYQRLLAAGLRDAHRSRGRGAATTFPNGMFPVPSMRLDHALISPQLTCLTIEEGRGWGSDHRPLLIELAL